MPPNRAGIITLPLILALAISIFASLAFLPGHLSRSQRSDLAESNVGPEQRIKDLKNMLQREDSTVYRDEITYLTREPMDVASLRNITLLLSIMGQEDKARALTLKIANRYWRDQQSQLRAINLHLLSKDYAAAMRHVDGLLRVRPRLGQELFPWMLTIASQPEAVSALAATLNTEPAWRRSFMLHVAQKDATGQVSHQLITAMRRQSGEIHTPELAALLKGLLDRKNVALAYFIWLDSLDSNALRRVGLMFDRDFELTPKNQFFDWTLTADPSFAITLVDLEGKQRARALQVDFFGRKKRFSHVSQHLRLAPGTYQLSGEWQASLFESNSGLQWHLSCLENPKQSATSQAFLQNREWQTFTLQFTATATACETQVLRLQSTSAASLDQIYKGSMQFRRLNLKALP